jgi:hypothetical protein
MAEPKTVTVYHPAFPDVSRDVPAADLDNWTEAGWRKTPLKSSEK